MKTKFPEGISTTKEAEKFLKELYDNGESFHPEDDVFTIIWDLDPQPDTLELIHLDKLMRDIWNLPELQNYPHNEWDPSGYLMDLFYEDHPELLEEDNFEMLID